MDNIQKNKSNSKILILCKSNKNQLYLSKIHCGISIQVQMDPIEIVLNCAYSYFKISPEAQYQIDQMTPRPCQALEGSDLPPIRFDPRLRRVIREMGDAASDQGSLLRIFRIHPMLWHHAVIGSRDGYERLIIEYEKAMLHFLHNIDLDKVGTFIQAIETQKEWLREDQRQGMAPETEPEPETEAEPETEPEIGAQFSDDEPDGWEY